MSDLVSNDRALVARAGFGLAGGRENASQIVQNEGANLRDKPVLPDHEMLRRVGAGSYGEVWLARNAVGTLRAIKIVYRKTFWHEHPFEREFKGIQKFEPISRSHEGMVDILQIDPSPRRWGTCLKTGWCTAM